MAGFDLFVAADYDSFGSSLARGRPPGHSSGSHRTAQAVGYYYLYYSALDCRDSATNLTLSQ